MKDSFANTTIYSIIDDEGILQSIEKKSLSLMSSSEPENYEEDEETKLLNKQVYDNNNQLSLEGMKPTLNEQKLNQNNNNLNFNLNSIFIIDSMIINRTASFEDKKINNKLYKYFDNFKYRLYIKDIKNQETIQNDDDNEKRILQEDGSYYGLKKMTYVKDLYKYNLLGINMQKQIFTEINPEKGTTDAYFVMIFGNINTKIKIDEQHTNLHILLEKKNQMAYNLLLLLNQSNYDLKERNKKYIEVLINMENNISSYFKDYDYSELFKDSLENLYVQVRNFSGDFFYEFILLINRVYENNTNLLNNSTNDKYDFMDQIVIIVRDEYIKYIYNMIDIMEKFENNSLIFFDNFEKEIKYLENFHIDLLYDVIDVIHEAKLLFKKFNKNLFKSIEKGILTFKYDINDYINEIIGDVLYVVDFLSININKNDIIKKSIDDDLRLKSISNLKSIKNIIMYLIEMVISNINKDYESQINLDNKNGIKNYSLQKENEFILNTDEKSNKLINNIKSKIKNIELYELYSENLDEINNLINKTITEYINDIYNNIILDSLNIKAEFLDSLNIKAEYIVEKSN